MTTVSPPSCSAAWPGEAGRFGMPSGGGVGPRPSLRGCSRAYSGCTTRSPRSSSSPRSPPPSLGHPHCSSASFRRIYDAPAGSSIHAAPALPAVRKGIPAARSANAPQRGTQFASPCRAPGGIRFKCLPRHSQSDGSRAQPETSWSRGPNSGTSNGELFGPERRGSRRAHPGPEPPTNRTRRRGPTAHA